MYNLNVMVGIRHFLKRVINYKSIAELIWGHKNNEKDSREKGKDSKRQSDRFSKSKNVD